MLRRLALVALAAMCAAATLKEGQDVGLVLTDPPKIFSVPTQVDFPSEPGLVRVRRADQAWRDTTAGNVGKVARRGSFDLVWLSIEDLDINAEALFYEQLVVFQGWAMAGRQFSLYLEGDNTNDAPLWFDAAAGATTLTVSWGFGSPFPAGRELRLRRTSTDPDIGAVEEFFVGLTVTALGFDLYEIGIDRPLVLDWPENSVVQSRWGFSQCVLLGDDGIIQRKPGNLFDVAMLVRTHADFATP